LWISADPNQNTLQGGLRLLEQSMPVPKNVATAQAGADGDPMLGLPPSPEESGRDMVSRHAGICIVALLALGPARAESFETRLSPSPLTAKRHPTAISPAGCGLGGGSPVGKPTTLLPDIHHPNNGNAIFVFALPDN
jgi:hypothetical protein